MAVFENCSVLFELKNLLFKEKKKLKSAVTENGGNICFVVNKQCSLIVTSDVSNLSTNRLRSIQKYQTPVVGLEYVYSCLESGVLLPVDGYKLDISPPSTLSPPLPPTSLRSRSPYSNQVSKEPQSKAVAEPSKGPAKPVTQSTETPDRSCTQKGKFRIYIETDSDLPTYPDTFQVAKYSIFEKKNSNTWCVLELQSFRGEKGWQYRVVRYWKDDILSKKAAVRDMLVFLSTSEEALEVYKDLRETLTATGLQPRSNIPPQAQHLGSVPLLQLLLEEKLNSGSLSQEVGVLVELLWTEALGCLSNILRVSVDKLSLNDVTRVEGLLLQAQRKLREASHPEVASLLDEINTLLPLREPLRPTAKLISQTLDLCQLIRDVLNVSEMNLRSPMPSCLGKYRALRCSIETVPPSSSEFQAVTALLKDSKVQIQQILRVTRGVELQTFKSDLGNIKPLLHSSRPSNFVGVLSRGLLLPRVGVEHHGIERTDIGNLGSGIYFSDAMSTSLKYSRPSETDGSRLVLVCDVALGQCKDVHKRDITLTQAPDGHHSVHGVRHTSDTHSEFQDDEYVVYSPDQVKLKYMVQFSIEGDQLKEFNPAIITSAEPSLPSSDEELGSEDSGIESIKNPLEQVTAGLLDSSGQQLPLQAVHVKCKLMDLLSQVIIFQKYTNVSSVPIEAKYVFPLDDSAAVCGFEAFINGKHVVGQVKEKEKARKEYKQAIEKGHGAYLMDQDAPDVFTISVGNLPPGATVLIKVTFVSELIVRDGSILFSLPGSVAPWQESAALNQTTQVTVEKVCVTDKAASTREFTLDVSIEMPYEISSLKCITHKVKIKRTDCKAVVSVLPGEVLGPEGFQLSVTLSEVHLPRMWVEKHPDKDSQACMLVFYPDFDVNSSSASNEIVLLLDTSESMKGESLRMAQRIALQVLKTLGHNIRLNVILFGTDHKEAFLTAQPLVEAHQAAESFIKRFSPVGGSTELWRPLRALSLLPPSCGVRNLLLLSDGHIQNPELTLKLLRDNTQHSRLFTCGLSPTANRHMLRALAQAGGGTFEFFDTKTKHNWAEKVAYQVKRMASPGCSSVSVKWQQFNPTAPPPVQAPKQLHALFNDCHTLVYGFVPHCTQATLLGNLSGQELKTMVSTSELQKTKGTFLHKLTARALIRDYEDGSLDTDEAEHEGKKAELKSFIIELSKEFSILSQFTSFVAIEERDSEQTEGFTDIPKLIAEEDVDFLPYISWTSPQLSSHSVSHCGDIMEEESDLCMEWEEDFSQEEFYDDMEELHEIESGDSLSSVSPDYAPTSALSLSEELIECCTPLGEPRSPMYTSFAPPPPLRLPRFRSSITSFAEPLALASPAPPPPPPPPFIRLAQTFDGPPPPPPVICPLGTSYFPPPPPPVPLLGVSFLPPPPPPPPPSCAAPVPTRKPTHDARLTRKESAMVQRSKTFFKSPLAMSTLEMPFLKTKGMAVKDMSGTVPSAPSAANLTEGFARSGLFSNKASSYQLVDIYETLSSSPPPKDDSFEGHQQQQSGFGFGFVEVREGTSEPPPSKVKSTARPIASFQKKKKRGLKEFCDGVELDESELATDGGERLVRNEIRICAASDSVESLSHTAPPATFAADLTICFGQSEGSLPIDKSKAHPASLIKAAGTTTSTFGLEPQPSLPPPLQQITVSQQQKRQSSGFAWGLAPSKVREELPGTSEPHSPSAKGVTANASWPKQRLRAGGEPTAQGGLGDRLSRAAKSFSKEHHGTKFAAFHQPFKSAYGELLKSRWTKIFQMQHSEGYWELTTELGEFMNVDVDLFANVFLKSKGIHSLGVRAHADILRLLATLLLLQMMRVEKLEEGELLRTLFCLDDSSQPRPERWEQVKRAVDWVCWADRQYPCVYSRLEFGLSWETSTRQLLGYEGLPPFSPLSGLNLQKTAAPLQVH